MPIPSMTSVETPNQVLPGANPATPSTPQQTNQPKKRSKAKVILFLVFVVVIFVVALVIFQPRIVFWAMKRLPDPKILRSVSSVTIQRQFTPVVVSEASQPYSDEIIIKTDTSFIAPDTYELSTRITNNGQSVGSDIDARLFGKEAYNKLPTDTQYQAYTFQEAPEPTGAPEQEKIKNEYESTIDSIRSSSFFQKGLLDFVQNARFVWNPAGGRWWNLHYRFEVVVGQIEKVAPSWYAKELYPFASEEGIGEQEVKFAVEVWVNPFTLRVEKERWTIDKESSEADQFKTKLDIDMDRSFTYPGNLTIDKPTL